MQQFNTPMMNQYKAIKAKYTDCLLFYRMGDFYELFLEDAHIGARILNITLTGKANGKQGRIPMAGVPYHAVDTYIAKLVKAGYKVAICEQVSLPNKRGLVEREVVRVVTPGTVLDERALEKKENNYIVSLYVEENTLALAYADISTGQFSTYESEVFDLGQTLFDELSKISPSECIVSESLYNDPEFLKLLKREKRMNIFSFKEWDSISNDSYEFLKKHFAVSTLEGFGLDRDMLALKPAAALIGYLQQTQKSTVSHIKKITRVDSSDYMVLDRSSIINLELFSTIREHDPKGSLLHVVDHTMTPMGGRLLRDWMRKPLAQKEKIDLRLDAVEELLTNQSLCDSLSQTMTEISDIERILSRLSVHIGNARDLVNLKFALMRVLDVKKIISASRSSLLHQLQEQMPENLQEVVRYIETHIVDEPPIDVKIGGMIREGVDTDLDRLRQTVMGSRDWILNLEHAERKRTGISSLKIRFNKVFGFYIEISKSNLDSVPAEYMRKQTLVNGERFITQELKEHEEIILSAEEKINTLEYELFGKILNHVLEYTDSIQAAARAIGYLDCLANFALVARKNEYVRPTLLYSGEIRITGGRHPVVEKLLDESTFVPNDVTLDTISQQQLLITGPNMAGKSVFIRQVALIVLMAQIGCFVPATRAHISVMDRIFVRSGASDVITSGLSTFMVEMVETAHILNNATKNSLIVMDEIGRGTSTYDGISIAWAVAEYLVTNFKTPPKTLFATHYHELQSLEEQYPNKIKNYHMAVADDSGSPIFLHTLLPGGASHSFGVAVAKLAGVPDSVIQKAKEILQNLEKRHIEERQDVLTEANKFYVSDSSLADKLVHKEIEQIDISRLTPLEALNKLAEIKEKITIYSKNEHTREVD